MGYGEGNGNPLQYACLENPMDGGAWQARVHGVTKSQTRLSDLTSHVDGQELGKERRGMGRRSTVPGEARVGGAVGAQAGGVVSTVLGGKEETVVIDVGQRAGAATGNRVFTDWFRSFLSSW